MFFIRALGVLFLAFILLASMFVNFQNLNIIDALRDPLDRTSAVLETLGSYFAIALGLLCSVWRPRRGPGRKHD